MNPKLRGLTSGLDRLNHKFDKRTDDLIARLPMVEKRGDVAFDRAHKHLDEKIAEFGDVESFVDDLEAIGNGGPSEGDSQESSKDSAGSGDAAHSTKAEPGASWSGTDKT